MNPLWYPYSQMKNMTPALRVRHAKGCSLFLDSGDELTDAISSWWSVIHGYNHPRLNAAAKAQIDRFSHVMLGGLSHDPAQQLAEKLVEISPPSLQHVFFADSGSIATEIALKIAIQYWQNQNKKNKCKLLSFKKAYHGDSSGAMSVSDPEEGMHHLFSALLPQHYFFDSPPSRTNPNLDSVFSNYCKSLYAFLEEHHFHIAGIIIEPLMQAAGGFNMYPPLLLPFLRKCCDEFNILLIFDEVATGFGRTGSLFACEQTKSYPDIMMLGKGLTCGYLGHAAVLTSSTVFNAFYSDDEHKALMHGPTFMGNPLACSIALEGIRIFEEEQYLKKIEKIETQFKKELEAFSAKGIKEVRILGATAVIEVEDKSILSHAQSFAIEKGVWLRPFDRFLYSMPSYVITESEIEKITRTMKAYFSMYSFQSRSSSV